LRKLRLALWILFAFASLETILAFDYSLFSAAGPSLVTWGGFNPQQPAPLQNVLLPFWRDSLSLSAFSWAIFGVTFYRKGISRKWRELGFDKEVFQLMINMRGAKSRLTLLNYLGEPRQRAELSKLSGLDWKEVDREIDLLKRFGLITLYAESGSVKLYKLSEQGRLMLKLIVELRERLPSEIENPQLNSSPQSF
jgi:DNA-binding transcriptional ArsR family regulator